MDDSQIKNELEKKAVAGVVWSTLQRWGSQSVTLVVFIVLVRLLDPAIFGLVATAKIFTDFSSLFIDQGFADAVVQREIIEDHHLSTAFWTSLAMGIFFMICTMVLAGTVSQYFNEPVLENVLFVLATNFLFAGLSSTQQAILLRKMEFRKLSLRAMISTAIGGIAGISLALAHYGVWSLVAQTLVASIVSTILLWKVSSWRPTFSFSISHFKQLFSFGVNITVKRILGYLDTRFDSFLIARFLGMTALGYYAVASNIMVTLSGLIVGMAGNVSFSAFARLQADQPRLQKAFLSVMKILIFIAIPFFFFVAILAPYLLPAMFGTQWTTSIPILQIMSITGCAVTLLTFHGILLLSVGKASWELVIRIILTIIRVTAFVIAVRYGLIMVALVFMISALMSFLPYIYTARSVLQFKLHSYLRLYTAPISGVISALLIIIGLDLITPHAYVHIPIYGVVILMVYLVVVYLLDPSLVSSIFRYGILLLDPYHKIFQGKSKYLSALLNRR